MQPCYSTDAKLLFFSCNPATVENRAFQAQRLCVQGLRANMHPKPQNPLSHAAMHVLNDCHGMAILIGPFNTIRGEK